MNRPPADTRPAEDSDGFINPPSVRPSRPEISRMAAGRCDDSDFSEWFGSPARGVGFGDLAVIEGEDPSFTSSYTPSITIVRSPSTLSPGILTLEGVCDRKDCCSVAVASRRRPPRVRRVAFNRSGRREWLMCFGPSVLGVNSCVHAKSIRRIERLARFGSGKSGVAGFDYRMRSAKAALTAGLACSAPSTTTEAIVARASSGVTSSEMVASPSTFMCSICPSARARSRSSRV